jgi:Membrane domain of glycerophosphoryl diester phosphodiesterase
MIRFDSNRAWEDAMRIVAANREVLTVLAGVFFFLPAVAALTYLTPLQGELAALQAKMSSKPNMAEMQSLMQLIGQMMPAFLALALVQIVGRMGMMALVTDQRRPTVGEALAIAVKCLPAMIGAFLVIVVVYFVAVIIVSLVAALLGAGINMAHSPVLTGLFAALIVAGALAGILFAFTRLLMLIPVIVIDGEHGPVKAIKRSWNMVQGNTARLFLFYILLALGTLVISLVASFGLKILGGLVGSAGLLLAAIGSALISSVIGVVMMAVLVAIHRQLASAPVEVVAEEKTSVWGG